MTNRAQKSLKEAWIKAMCDILFSGSSEKVEDYSEIVNYSTQFGFDNVYELSRDERICSDFEEMKKVFFTSKSNIFNHSYADSIINPIQSIKDPVESIAFILQKNVTTRKAVLTFTPYGDEKVPCINDIQFLVRDNVLNIIYNSRGQDIYRKFPCDAMCIASFGESVAKSNGYKLGMIYANISSAHIYEHDKESAKDCIFKGQKEIILTGNALKYSDYMQSLCKHGIKVVISKVELPEIQSVDPVDVVKAKAKSAYEYFGYPIWVDDISLSLKDYPLFPGPYTKSIFKQIGIEGLRQLLSNKSQKGTIVCRLCKYDGMNFTIIDGENNGYFDFDKEIENEKMPLNAIFIGEGFMKHRNMAIKKLIEYVASKVK